MERRPRNTKTLQKSNFEPATEKLISARKHIPSSSFFPAVKKTLNDFKFLSGTSNTDALSLYNSKERKKKSEEWMKELILETIQWKNRWKSFISALSHRQSTYSQEKQRKLKTRLPSSNFTLEIGSINARKRCGTEKFNLFLIRWTRIRGIKEKREKAEISWSPFVHVIGSVFLSKRFQFLKIEIWIARSQLFIEKLSNLFWNNFH